MTEKYKDFLEKNPTIESRIEAFTSGILTPDTKAITLWAMEPGRFYTGSELYTRVRTFAGGQFPIIKGSVWNYCNGTPGKYEGSLYNIGAVIKDEITIEETSEGQLINVLYAKSPTGEDFGDTLAARALLLSQQLDSRYKSMLRILGASNKSKSAKTRRGYAIYKIIKELATYPNKIYSEVNLEQILMLNASLLSHALNTLGNIGIIEYESPEREIKGKTTSGWSLYRLNNTDLLKKDLEYVFDEIKQIREFEIKGYLAKVLQYIKDNPDKNYEYNALSQRLKINPYPISLALSALMQIGYLTSRFKGRERTKTKSNQSTSLLWKILLEPIEAIAQRLDPSDYKGFYEPLEKYEDDTIRKQDIQQHLRIYENERTHRGLQGSKEINCALLSLPNIEMKASEIREIVERKLKRIIGSDCVYINLARLVKSGKFEKTGKGRYLRK